MGNGDEPRHTGRWTDRRGGSNMRPYHNFYSTNFTHLRVISLGRKHITPGSEWGMDMWSSMERDGKISTRRKSVSAKPVRVAHPLKVFLLGSRMPQKSLLFTSPKGRLDKLPKI